MNIRHPVHADEQDDCTEIINVMRQIMQIEIMRTEKNYLKPASEQNENPDTFEKQGGPGFCCFLTANFIVVTAHRADHSLKFENDADETSRTAGRQLYYPQTL